MKTDIVSNFDQAFREIKRGSEYWANIIEQNFLGITMPEFGGLPGFQTGGTFTVSKPTPIVVHPNELIDITPFSKMGKGQVGGESSGAIVNYTVNISAIDSQDVYRFMKTAGREALEELIRANLGGISRIISKESDYY